MSATMTSEPTAKSPAAKPKGDDQARTRLGRGLAALIGDSGGEPEAIVRTRGQKRVPIEFVKASTFNPRVNFEGSELQELTDSIREKGIIQPILVRTVPGVADAYEIVAGERRWRAAAAAGLHEVPIITIEADDKQALEIAIIENVQRSNLNVIEEAMGYQRLQDEFGYTQGDLAKVIGKSRPHVNNAMRLLKLPDQTRQLISADAISAGHARAMLAAADPVALGERIVRNGLSVRAVEEIIKREQEAADTTPEPRTTRSKDADTRALEQRIRDRLGMAVDIKHDGGEKGEVRLKYGSLEQLDRLVSLLGG